PRLPPLATARRRRTIGGGTLRGRSLLDHVRHRLHHREVFDDSVYHGSTFNSACRHDCRRSPGPTGFCPAAASIRTTRNTTSRRATFAAGIAIDRPPRW